MPVQIKQRLPFLDAAKAIGIILVIYGHCTYHPGILYRIPTFIYAFHMPLFFIISGYLLKPMSVQQATVKYFKAYLKPGLLIIALKLLLFLMIPLFVGLENAEQVSAYEIATITDIYFGPVWFFFALFWACLLYQTIIRFSPDWNRLLIIIAIFILSVSSERLIRLPFSIQSGMFALPFIEVGRLLKKINFPQDIHSANKTSFIIMTLIFLFSAGKGGFNIAQLDYNPNHLNLMGGIIGSIFLLQVVNKFNILGGAIGLVETHYQ